MQEHRIGFDLDGVVCNFIGGHVAKLMETTGKNLFPPTFKNDPPCWDYDKHFGYSEVECKAVWNEIMGSGKFWKDLQPLPAMLTLSNTINSGPLGMQDIFFITTRPGTHVKAQTIFWLEQYGIERPQVIISAHKGELAAGLELTSFIDDKPSNVQAVEYHSPSTRSYLLATSWNGAERNTVQRVVNGLEDFLQREGF